MIHDIRSANFLIDVADGFASCESASLAVAFITQSGLDLPEINKQLTDAVTRGANIRLMVDLLSGNTDPAAVWQLRSWSKDAGNLDVRALLPANNRLLHSKFYLFQNDDQFKLISGSANLSAPAYLQNVEHGILIHGSVEESQFIEAQTFYDELWSSPDAMPLDDESARLYEEFCGRIRATRRRSASRAQGIWRRLEEHLRATTPTAPQWPSPSLAYALGAVAARGEFNDTSRSVEIKLRFSAKSYPSGEIRLHNTVFPVDVLNTIPEYLADRLRAALPLANVTVNGFHISADLSSQGDTYDALIIPFRGARNTHEFRLPDGLTEASEDVVTEFIRGFANASGLVTDATSLPGHRLTGLPGIQTVWLRPQTGNKRLFDELEALIERRLGIKVYTQWREYKEPHLKIRCEDFQEKLGFGLEWWDALVEAGAQYNEEMFGQQPSLPLFDCEVASSGHSEECHFPLPNPHPTRYHPHKEVAHAF